jgi:DnaJ-class molecular chaperone
MRPVPERGDETATCSRCKGAQEIDDRPCAWCEGEGVVIAEVA